MPKVKIWLEQLCYGPYKTLNIFAGETLLNINEYRNDINCDMPAKWHYDANKLAKYFRNKGIKFDNVILDPPYNWRKAKEKYGNKMIGNYPLLKDDLKHIIKIGGKVISFGYDTVGMSESRGFKKVEVLIVCHSGDFHDTLGLVEIKEKEIA